MSNLLFKGTLGDPFDLNRRSALGYELFKQTQKVRAKVAKKRSNADTKTIETELNNIFYPKDTNPLIDRKQLQEEMVNEMVDTMVNKISNIASSAASLSDADFKQAYSGNEDSTGFQLQRISSMIQQAESRLKSFSNIVDTQNLEKIAAGVAQMKTLQSELYSLVQQYANSEKSTIKYNQFDVSKRSQIMSLLKTIYLLYEAIDNKLTVKDWEVFERALAESNRYFISGTQAEVEALIKQSLVGSQTAARGGNSVITVNVSTNSSVSSLKNNKGFKMEGEKASISFNPYSKKQGKMDVQLYWESKFDGTQDDYRVSAKRWTKGASKFGLGTTSILNAIARSTGDPKYVDYYALGLLRTKDQFHWIEGLPPTTAMNEAHQLARLSLLADISMGVSQTSNYANLLIIDMGKKKGIKVYNIVDMINDYLAGQEALFEFSGYNEKQIENLMAGIYNNNIRRLGRVNPHERSNSYLGLAQAKLNAIKITIHPKF